MPGNGHAIFPSGFGRRIPAGATLSFQMQHTPNGTPTVDQTQLGLLFATEPPRHARQVAGIATRRLSIPPGASHHAETATTKLVRWGQQTEDEMMLGYVEYYIPGRTPARVSQAERR